MSAWDNQASDQADTLNQQRLRVNIINSFGHASWKCSLDSRDLLMRFGVVALAKVSRLARHVKGIQQKQDRVRIERGPDDLAKRSAHGVCRLLWGDHVAAPREKRKPRVSGAASGRGPFSGIGVGDTPDDGATCGTPQLPEAQPPVAQSPVEHPPEGHTVCGTILQTS